MAEAAKARANYSDENLFSGLVTDFWSANSYALSCVFGNAEKARIHLDNITRSLCDHESGDGRLTPNDKLLAHFVRNDDTIQTCPQKSFDTLLSST